MINALLTGGPSHAIEREMEDLERFPVKSWGRFPDRFTGENTLVTLFGHEPPTKEIMEKLITSRLRHCTVVFFAPRMQDINWQYRRYLRNVYRVKLFCGFFVLGEYYIKEERSTIMQPPCAETRNLRLGCARRRITRNPLKVANWIGGLDE